jgi:hypothetical protein
MDLFHASLAERESSVRQHRAAEQQQLQELARLAQQIERAEKEMQDLALKKEALKKELAADKVSPVLLQDSATVQGLVEAEVELTEQLRKAAEEQAALAEKRWADSRKATCVSADAISKYAGKLAAADAEGPILAERRDAVTRLAGEVGDLTRLDDKLKSENDLIKRAVQQDEEEKNALQGRIDVLRGPHAEQLKSDLATAKRERASVNEKLNAGRNEFFAAKLKLPKDFLSELTSAQKQDLEQSVPREWLAGKIAAAAAADTSASDPELAVRLAAVTAQAAASLDAFKESPEVKTEWTAFSRACELQHGAAAGDGRRALQKAIDSLVAAALRAAAQRDGASDNSQAAISSMGQELVLLEGKTEVVRTRLGAFVACC